MDDKEKLKILSTAVLDVNEIKSRSKHGSEHNSFTFDNRTMKKCAVRNMMHSHVIPLFIQDYIFDVTKFLRSNISCISNHEHVYISISFSNYPPSPSTDHCLSA